MTINRLAALEEETAAPASRVPTIGAERPPVRNRLEGLEAQINGIDANRDPEKEARDILSIGESTQSPLAAVEDHYPLIAIERDFLRKQNTGNREDITPEALTFRPLAEQIRRIDLNPVGMIENIRHKSPADWVSIPDPTGYISALDDAALLEASRRIEKNAYETEGKGYLGAPMLGSRGVRLIDVQPDMTPEKLRDRDKRLIEQKILWEYEKQQRGMTFGAEVFDGLSHMPSWMLAFAISGGAAKLGSETAKTIVLKTLQGYAKTAAGRTVLKGAGWAGGAISRTTLGMPLRVADEILERRIPSITVGPDNELTIGVAPESWATSIAKGWGSAVIETASESAGEGIVKGGKVLAGKTLGSMPFGSRLYDGLRQAYLSIHPEPGAASAFVEKFFSATKYDGLVGEIGEERVATILHAIAGTQDFGLGPDAGALDRLKAGLSQDLTIKNLAAEAAVLAVPGAAGAVTKVLDSARARGRIAAYAQGELAALEKIETPTPEQAGEREFLKANIDAPELIVGHYAEQINAAAERTAGTKRRAAEPFRGEIVSEVGRGAAELGLQGAGEAAIISPVADGKGVGREGTQPPTPEPRPGGTIEFREDPEKPVLVADIVSLSRDLPAGHYIRVSPNRYNPGDILPPSVKMEGGYETERTHKGTSVIDPRHPFDKWDLNTQMYHGYVYEVTGTRPVRGQDPGEWRIRNATVVRRRDDISDAVYRRLHPPSFEPSPRSESAGTQSVSGAMPKSAMEVGQSIKIERPSPEQIVTLYHGTDADIGAEQLSASAPAYEGSLGGGIYFGEDAATAELYGKNVLKASVRVANPLVIDADEGTNYRADPEAETLRNETGSYDSILQGEQIIPFDVKIAAEWVPIRNAEDLASLSQRAQKAGHDALIVRGIRDNATVNEEVVVFDKNQIQAPEKKTVREVSGAMPKSAMEETPEAVRATHASPQQSVWDQALADADEEAAQQARERYVGPEEWTFEDYAGELAGRSDEELGQMARKLGAKVPGATGENLRKWIGDAAATLTKAGPEPQPAIQGEKHPGSMTYKKFFERYGQVLAKPDEPANAAWTKRYGPEATEGVRGLYKRLRDEWHRINAWQAFWELTGQERPTEGEIGQQATHGATQQPSGEAGQSSIINQPSSMEGPPVDAEWPRTEEEAREIASEEGARDTTAAINDFFGNVPPTDLPPGNPADPDGIPGPEPSAKEYSLLALLLHRLGIRSKDGYTPFSKKDFREIYKHLQLPDDIRRTFPQFDPVYQVQMGRERAKQVLDRVLADKAKAYFDLTDADRKAVDEFQAAIDQHPGDNEVLNPLQAKLTPTQLDAWKAIRQTLDYAGELLVQRMKDLGVDEERINEFMGRLGNYIPHKWYGAWAVVVKERLTPEQIKEQGGRARTVFMSAVGYTERFTEQERLMKIFPGHDVDVFERTKIPMEAFQDAPAAAVGKMVELVIDQAQAKQAGRKDLPDDVKNQLMDSFRDLYKSKGFGMHFIQRKETPGWTEDLRMPIREYLAGFSGFLTKMEAGLKFNEAIGAIDPRRTPNLYKYATQYIRFVMGDEAYWTRLKPLLYAYYMYGNIKTSIVNSSQNLMLGWPVLSKHTGRPLAKMMRAMGRTATGQLTDGEKGFIDQLEKEGYLDAKLTQEISALGGNAIYRAAAEPMGKLGALLDFNRRIEGFNRRAMAAALFDAGITDLERAGGIIDEAHFHYGKGNRPTLARGHASAIMVFRSYTINQLTWIKNEIKAGRIGPLARHLAAWVLVGGLKALPLAGAAAAIYVRAFGSDPEEDAAEFIGDTAAEILFRGVPSQAGVTLTGSVGMQDIVPTIEPGQDWDRAVGEWVLGVAADIPARFGRVTQDLETGQWARALEDASPEALKNPLAAYRLHREGATTRSGRVVWDYDADKQLQLGNQEMVLKMLGFQPDKIATQYDKERLIKIVNGQVVAAKSQWADRLYLANQQEDDEAKTEIVGEIEAFNAKLKRRGQGELVISVKEMTRALNSRNKPVNWPTEDEAAIYRSIWGEKKTETAGTKK